jgi:hypothetical protein
MNPSHRSKQRETANHNSPRRGNPPQVRKFGRWYNHKGGRFLTARQQDQELFTHLAGFAVGNLIALMIIKIRHIRDIFGFLAVGGELALRVRAGKPDAG